MSNLFKNNKDRDRRQSSRQQRDSDYDPYASRKPVATGYEATNTVSPSYLAQYGGHDFARPIQEDVYHPALQNLSYEHTAATSPVTPQHATSRPFAQAPPNHYPPTPPSETKIHNESKPVANPGESSAAPPFDPNVAPVKPPPAVPLVPIDHEIEPPTSADRGASSDSAKASNFNAPRARVLEPSFVSGMEGKEWDDILGEMTFHGAREEEFLDLLDEMRKHGLDRELSLPRLVVCGKQSSGKSSVMEAITRLAFPRGETTCTRFVTEIIMIRDMSLSGTSVMVTIQPGDNRDVQDAAALRAFRETCTPSGFGLIFGRAAKAMGLAKTSTGEMTAFSRDKFCIEIRGPKCQRISLIDLPGLISANKGAADDIRMVEAITEEYIKEERTVILAVVNAEGNTNDHSILEKAKAVDPKGERTFGIITKPDMLAAGLDNETDWLNLAKQNSEAFWKFGKGCHVMVNRDGRDTKDGTSSDARDNNEKMFFSSETWMPGCGLAKNEGEENRWHSLYATKHWGVKHLRPRLTQLLFRHTQKQIKSLRRDIDGRVADYDADLKRLGAGLLEPKDLRQALVRKCMNMSHKTVQGVDGTNRDADFFGFDEYEISDGPARFLRGRIRVESAAFNKSIHKDGHQTQYAWGPDEETPAEFPDVDAFYTFLEQTMGTELPGNFDPQRLTPLFIHYSKPWRGIAQEYLDRAYIHSREFIRIIVSEVVGKEMPDIEKSFREHVLESRLESLKNKADDQLREIEQDRKGNVITEDMRFLAESTERFAIRQVNWLTEGSKNDSAVDLSEIKVPTDPDSKRHQAAIQMIDQMHSYYRIARARYVDNIIIQVVERCLLSKLRDLFDPDWMEDQELYNLITSDPHTEERRAERDRLAAKRKNLKQCLIRLESLDR